MSKKLLTLFISVVACCAFGCSDDNDNACKEGDRKCSGTNLTACENGKWITKEQCAHGCDATKNACKETDDTGKACTPQSVTECSAACSEDGTKGYYWSDSEKIVKTYECYTGKTCKLDGSRVSCVAVSTGKACTAESTEACDAACSEDGSAGYYWDGKNNRLGTKTCNGDNKCTIKEGEVICQTPSTGEACDPTKDMPTCGDGDNTVKYCREDDKEYVVKKDCPQCHVDGDTFFCNGDHLLENCTKNSKEKCRGACDAEISSSSGRAKLGKRAAPARRVGFLA